MGTRWSREGAQRERLAAYLITAPPLARQTPAQKKQTRAVLQRLWRVETESVLRQAGVPRLLRQGDMLALVVGVLYSAVRLVGPSAGRLSVIVPVHRPAVLAAMEPRILQIGLVALLRELLAEGHVTARVEQEAGFLRVCFQGERPPLCRTRPWRLAKETARLHQGSLAVNRDCIVLRLNTGCRAAQPAVIPTVAALSSALTAVPVMGLFPFIPLC